MKNLQEHLSESLNEKLKSEKDTERFVSDLKQLLKKHNASIEVQGDKVRVQVGRWIPFELECHKLSSIIFIGSDCNLKSN